MGNTSAKSHPRHKNKKVHWKAADRPSRPGKPQLVPNKEGAGDVLSIRWDRPFKDGGSPITGYIVEHRRFGSPHWLRATPLPVLFPEAALSGLEPGWRYQFRVTAENIVGLSEPSELSEPLTVTLSKSSITTPRFTQELTETSSAIENDKIEFVVHFLGQPYPKISWFKDGFEIFSSRRIRILTESDRSVLTVHQCQIVDAGEIKCTATNKAGHTSTKTILAIEAPPSIRLPRQYEEGLLFEIGEMIRLKVSIAGLPAPLVFWSHNGESIQNSERYEIETFDNTSTLRISDAKRTDRGEYQIKAVNKLGQDSTAFLVTVTDKPSAPGKARVVMTLGKSVTLAWNTPEDDGGCKIGNYIIEYYRLGWDVWLKAATSRQMTAVLGDLIEGSQYKFRVKAESPYGISEPSDESEVVFIPDAKRGITEPRSLSQPREVQTTDETPTLPTRRKPRSQSTRRAEQQHHSGSAQHHHHVQFQDVPLRPERTKLKSPYVTPEPSPRMKRKEFKTGKEKEVINKAIFDRASMTRDLAYGTPDFKIKKTDLPRGFDEKPISSIKVIDNRKPLPTPKIDSKIIMQNPNPVFKSRSPSPLRNRSPSPRLENMNGTKIRSPAANRRFVNARSPSPNVERKTSKDFTGSSEFMLVLLPHEHRSNEEHDDFNFDDSLIPPPLSLSAPELGVEPPLFEGLKYSASSSELLHERALQRFYETAIEDEKLEAERNREKKMSSHIPKIQINDKNEEEITLERKLSMLRRFSAGVANTQHVWAQKRHSLRNAEDIQEIFEGKLRKFSLTLDDKKGELVKQRSDDNGDTENVKKQRPKLVKKKHIDVLDLEKWKEEYEGSDSESSIDERIYDNVPDVRVEEEEDTTYNPFMSRNRKEHEPFEILTKPNKLPDPNFKPKPILKYNNGKSPSTSPPVSPEISDSEKRNSLPWVTPKSSPSNTLDVKTQPRRASSPTVEHKPFQTISAIASISGFAAAGVVIPKPLLSKKKYEEEAKVVIDHYADIVKSHSSKNKTVKSDDKAKNSQRSDSRTEKVDTSQEEIDTCQGTKFSSEEKFISRDKSKPAGNRVDSKSSTPFTDSSSENVRRHNGTRSRHDSSSSGRSSTPTKYRERRGSPTVLNKELKSFKSNQEETKSRRTQSKSPGRRKKQSSGRSSPSIGRLSSPTSGRLPSPTSRRLPSQSPGRLRHLSVSSVETTSLSTQTSIDRTSPPRLRPPKMKEIMTQTSTCIDNIISDTAARISATFKQPEVALKETAEKKVRSTIDYVTDLAMFAVACWLYLFDNELLALPVLLIMVYRQLQDEVRKRMPNWMLRKPKE